MPDRNKIGGAGRHHLIQSGVAWKAVHERHDGAATFDESTPGVHIGDVGELII